jgi:hypothetical protein
MGYILTTSDVKLITFVAIDKYIYSYHYHVIGQSRFSINELTGIGDPIELSRTASFPYSHYYEVCDPTILSKKYPSPPFKNLGLSQNMKNIK